MTLPKISNKQQEILTLIYRFRFLNRIQIQSLLNHKDYKTINLWLKDLNQKEYLGKIYSTKFIENTKPAIYYIDLNGVRYLRSLDYPPSQLKKLYIEKDRTGNFIEQSQFIADIYLDLLKSSDGKFSAATASELADSNSPYYFLNDLQPDLVFAKEVKVKKTSATRYYITQIFEPNLPVYAIRKKIKEYFDFYFANEWEDNMSPNFPTLFFICSDLSKLIYAKRFTKKLLIEYDDIDLNILFAEKQEVIECGFTGEIWE